MYCSHCGKEVNDDAVICPYCGCETANKRTGEKDGSSIGFAVLGFFFPLVGLILYLVWKSNLPLRAKSAGKGALIGVCVSVGVTILYSVITVLALTAIM